MPRKNGSHAECGWDWGSWYDASTMPLAAAATVASAVSRAAANVGNDHIEYHGSTYEPAAVYAAVVAAAGRYGSRSRPRRSGSCSRAITT